MSAIDDILKSCSGVKHETKEHKQWNGRTTYSDEFYKVGDIKLPDGDIFIEITATATKGTIGRVVDIEVETYGERYSHNTNTPSNKIVSYDNTIIYECEGRKQTGRIKDSYCKVLLGHHQTKYVRNVNTHEKVKVKNPINKYRQEMQRGDWVIGVRPGKRLGIGRITRWTNHNVWAVGAGDDLNDKRAEFKFDSIQETFTMPNDEHVEMLTWAVLKGWKGD